MEKNGNFDAPNDRVEFPGGNVKVKGNFSYKARYQRDDQPESSYDLSLRYHLSLTGKNYGGKTKKIPQTVLYWLCGNIDPHQSPIRIKAIVVQAFRLSTTAPEIYRCHTVSNGIFTNLMVISQPVAGSRHRRIKL